MDPKSGGTPGPGLFFKGVANLFVFFKGVARFTTHFEKTNLHRATRGDQRIYFGMGYVKVLFERPPVRFGDVLCWVLGPQIGLVPRYLLKPTRMPIGVQVPK